MSVANRPPLSLQENLITIIAYSDESGRFVAQAIDPTLFEGDYQIIAQRCIDYWHKHGAAPKLHTADLFADVLEDANNRRGQTYRRILMQMAQLSEGMNEQYIIGQLKTFTRLQTMKDAILKTAEQLNQPHDATIEEVEEILSDLLRARDFQFERGLTLTDLPKLISYLENKQHEFDTGIPELDRANIVPQRGTVMTFLAATGKGKTWWLIQLGKRALMQGKKVAHISVEADEEQILQRYYQMLFAVPKRENEVGKVSTLEFSEEDHQLVDITQNEVPIDFSLDSPELAIELGTRLELMSTKTDNLIIKRFPPRSLTIAGLSAYLDSLEMVERFIPDLIVLDYIGRLKTDPRNPRLSLGNNMEDFRGLLIERNMAGATAQQVSKQGAYSKQVTAGHVAEDWSIIHTSDNVLSYSQTKAEEQFGLARLYVEKARDERGKFGILLTQGYSTGQFVLQSTMLKSAYFDLARDIIDQGEEEYQDGDANT